MLMVQYEGFQPLDVVESAPKATPMPTGMPDMKHP